MKHVDDDTAKETTVKTQGGTVAKSKAKIAHCEGMLMRSFIFLLKLTLFFYIACAIFTLQACKKLLNSSQVQIPNWNTSARISQRMEASTPRNISAKSGQILFLVMISGTKSRSSTISGNHFVPLGSLLEVCR